jgi:hypothetical protein
MSTSPMGANKAEHRVAALQFGTPRRGAVDFNSSCPKFQLSMSR